MVLHIAILPGLQLLSAIACTLPDALLEELPIFPRVSFQHRVYCRGYCLRCQQLRQSPVQAAEHAEQIDVLPAGKTPFYQGRRGIQDQQPLGTMLLKLALPVRFSVLVRFRLEPRVDSGAADDHRGVFVEVIQTAEGLPDLQ